MTLHRAGLTIALTALAALTGWVLFIGLPRWTAPRPAQPAAASPAAPATSPKIRARLFYIAPSSTKLQTVEREVQFGDTPASQARRIIEAQLEPAPEPFVSPIPAGTKLRNLYFTPSGIAYVDLSPEVSRAHPGGSLAEILTVYSVVNALMENLPAVTGVQILVNGREVDTLAGHVDLRRPLQKSAHWTETPALAPPAQAPQATAPAQTSGAKDSEPNP
jgi:spore germination protein GerM